MSEEQADRAGDDVVLLGIYDPNDPSTDHLRPILDPHNANLGTEEGTAMLQRSLEKYGAGRGTLSDRNRIMLAGNKTVENWVAMGGKVAYVETDGTTLVVTQRRNLDYYEDPEAVEIGVIDNRSGEVNLRWSPEVIADLAHRTDVDLSLSFTDVELEDFSLQARLSEDEVQPGYVPESEEETEEDLTPPADPVTKPGDLIALGPHRLLCGDATDRAAVGRLLGDALVDLVWTDPPYGVSYAGHTKPREELAQDELRGEDFTAFLLAAFTAAHDACRPGAPWYVCAPSGPPVQWFGEALSTLGVWRQTIIWVKQGFVMGRSDYHYRHEQLFYGWKEGAAHPWYAGRDQDTVWEIARPMRSDDHPTTKPLELAARALRNSLRAGGLVYDPFVGSGTALLAADRLGRVCCAMEIDPGYCDVVCRRWSLLTNEEVRRP